MGADRKPPLPTKATVNDVRWNSMATLSTNNGRPFSSPGQKHAPASTAVLGSSCQVIHGKDSAAPSVISSTSATALGGETINIDPPNP